MKKISATLNPFIKPLFLLFILLSSLTCRAGAVTADTAVVSAIKQSVNSAADNGANFPASVKRFYERGLLQPAWINTANQKLTTDAMLLLDCVLQYGLSHADFHPQELTYDQLKAIVEQPQTVDVKTKARFDVLLTDAMITMINYLHYGKLNPYYDGAKVDQGAGDIDAATVLQKALKNGRLDDILNVQPKVQAYADMQAYMRLWKGQFTGDCYEEPTGDVEKVALNMERLRWALFNSESYLWVNIPSFTLFYRNGNAVEQFRVIVGKPSTPTPTLNSSITYFTTAPEWKVPAKIFARELLPKALKDADYLENNHYAIYNRKGNFIEPSKENLATITANPAGYYARQSAGCDNSLGLIVFRFNNPYDIYLHDTPQQALFAKDERAFSHGCIRVKNARKLATLLLVNDKAAAKVAAMETALDTYDTKDFRLKTALPIKITYVTCTIKEGQVQNLPDVYNRDKALALALFMKDKTRNQPLAEH
ncbi:L,D-transpeptidase family protein [Mucilaginibacter sp. RS28]|uniref:L,D-transpeptidase family protein n=1 Tax=Mucilaginibacter straminoryzae TaxID=2932774 RepID=A0A9X1X258_9SPHI|nr:L,D-transpeptidase family protein [Mucilaginibacter straminoryzae]MCJ8208970.1 L,D-transpeptidase family protein [Mucilaginibacter straminoryzae]